MRQWLLLLVIAAGIGLSACGGSAPEAPATLKVYDFHGEIMQINKADKVLLVKHDAIGDWMEAMTMEFPVADPADIDRLSVGDVIDAKLEVRGLDYRLTKIRVAPKPPEPATAAPPK